MLLSKDLKQPNIKENQNNPELSDWAVGVQWFKTLDRTNAVTRPGIFANQNVVYKLRDQSTIDFLASYYPILD
ncbi:hypothetical protein COK03_26840 [Priestia megaterium]|nr:hypothetical protein COK03_26840 [Priestia megaterium]